MLSTLQILIIAFIGISFAVGNYCINTLFANKIKVQKQYNLHLWFGTNQSKTETEILFLSFASCWILYFAIIVGNFYWTHHFYNLLGAKYTFDAHRINDVPISMFMATHAYFCFYHSLTNICIRRMRRTMYYSSCNSKGKLGLNFAGFENE